MVDGRTDRRQKATGLAAFLLLSLPPHRALTGHFDWIVIICCAFLRIHHVSIQDCNT